MRLKHACIAIATCATPDLFLKHLDATLAIYRRRQIKHLKKHLKTLETHSKTYGTSR
jgi:hypothetical protein